VRAAVGAHHLGAAHAGALVPGVGRSVVRERTHRISHGVTVYHARRGRPGAGTLAAGAPMTADAAVAAAAAIFVWGAACVHALGALAGRGT